MIRRIINRIRRTDPSPVRPINTIGLAHAHVGATSASGEGARRGITRTPMAIVKVDRRAASKRARIARRAGR